MMRLHNQAAIGASFERVESNKRRVYLPEPVYSAAFDFQTGRGPEVLQLDQAAIAEFPDFLEYRLHIDLAALGLKPAGMVRNLDDFDQIPIALHMTEQIPIHALDMRRIKNHPHGSVTGRACDLAALVKMGEQH